MGSNNPELLERKARLQSDTAFRDLLVKLKNRQIAKITALKAQTPCPPQTTPQPVPPAGTAEGGCTNKSQAEIDSEIAEATADLLKAMRDIRAAEDAIGAAQKEIDAGRSRNQDDLRQAREVRDYYLQKKAELTAKIAALRALHPCPKPQIVPSDKHSSFQLHGDGGIGYGLLHDDGDDINVWSVLAHAVITLDTDSEWWSHVNIQGDFGYDDEASSGHDVSAVTYGGRVFWRDGDEGAFGVSLGETSTANHGFDFNDTNYGAFGEYYPSQSFTLLAKGGGFDGDFHVSGDYVGGGVRFYPTPNIALTGRVDYIALDHSNATFTDYTAKAEIIPMPDFPASIYAGYALTEFGATSTHSSTVFIGLKVYLGSSEPGAPLVIRHRTGAIDTDRSIVESLNGIGPP